MKLHELGQSIRITLNGNAQMVMPTDHPKYKEVTRLEDYKLVLSSGPPDAPVLLFEPRKPTVVLANLERGIGAAVIVNGATVYHEDDDKGYSQNFTAADVAKRLAKTLKVKLQRMALKLSELDGGAEEWNFDDVEKAANARTK